MDERRKIRDEDLLIRSILTPHNGWNEDYPGSLFGVETMRGVALQLERLNDVNKGVRKLPHQERIKGQAHGSFASGYTKIQR